MFSHFADDKRVVAWDIYKKLDNVASQLERAKIKVQEKHIYTLALLKKAVKWTREVDPSQPLTVGLWKGDYTLWGKS